MAKSLKHKVEKALKKAVGKKADIRLEIVPANKVGGIVLSASFATESPSERQDRIWKSLDEHLTPLERTRVVFIVTDTPDEYEALKRAAG
jgi:hypothetical protein